jgi:hypothetical protein
MRRALITAIVKLRADPPDRWSKTVLTVNDAKLIAAVVTADAEASKRIDSNFSGLIPASWGVAGGIRNAGYVALGMVTLGQYADPSEPEFANRVCTGISDAATNALNRAIAKADARLRNVKGAVPISRVLNGIDHTAVQIEMRDGQQHVFDWHATLDARNPMLFPSPAQWVKGQGGLPLKDFAGWN